MGGQSFKCPLCNTKPWWTLNLQSLRDHIRDKHGMPKASFTLAGPTVTAIEFEYCGVRCTETY
jgi:hypothetical protein